MILTALQWLITKIYNFIHNTKFSRPIVEACGLGAAIYAGVLIHRHFQPVYTKIQTAPTIQTVTVDRPVLTDKLITKVLSDPKDKAAIAALLAQNKKLSLTVTELSQTTGTLTQHNDGPMVPVTPTAPGTAISYAFKDWHLNFRTDLKTGTYDLTQKFEILSSTGKDKDGNPVTVTSLFEIGPNGERIPVTSMNTVNVFAVPTSPHWLTHLNVQGGISYDRDAQGKFAPLGVAALQWLKHGSTSATEDVSYAILSPAVLFGSGVQDIGVLPVSINLGRLPHQPFSNLWLSPVLTKSRLGFALTATF